MHIFHHQPLSILRERSKLIIAGALFFGAISFGISLLFPLEYRADAQALIISRSRYGIDPYTSVKSAEQVGSNIVQIMGTNDFFEKVVANAEYPIRKEYFTSVSEREKRKLWQKSVGASVVYGTGVLNISAYGATKDDAVTLASAVADTLARRGWEYVGGDITIKIVNQPVATKWPVRPNLLVNSLMGMVVGAVLMMFVLVRRYR